MTDPPEAGRRDPRIAGALVAEERGAAQTREMLAELSRLIEALDRRVPRLERIGEAQIARDAAELRDRAVRLIQRIEARAKAGESGAPK